MALSVSGFPEPSKTPTSPDPSPALDDGYKLMNSPRLRGFFGKKPDFGGGSGTIASGSGSTSKLPPGRDTFYADVDSSYVSSAPTNTPPSTPPIASYMPTFAQTSSDDDEYESYRQELLQQQQQQQQQQQYRDQQQQQTVIMPAPIPIDSRAMVPITLPSHTTHKRPQPLPPIPRKANASPVRIQPSLTRLDIGARPTNAVKPGILKSSTTGPGGFVTGTKPSTIPMGTVTSKSTSTIGGSKPALPMPPTVVVEEWSSSKSPASTNDGRSTPPRPLPAPPPKKEKEKFVNAVAGPSRLPANAVAGASGSSSSNASANPSSSTSYSQSAATSSTSNANTSAPSTPSAAVTTTPTHRRTSSSGTSRPPSSSATVPRARSTSNTRTRSTSRARAQRAAVRYQSMAMDHDGSSDTSNSSANMGNNNLRPLPAPPSAVLRTAPLPTPFTTGVGASRYTSPSRSKRPRTSPTSNGLATGGPSGSRTTPFDAIPISWASRPIDLNPAQQKQPPHSAGIMSGGRTQPAHPQGQRTRSQSRTRREVSLETPRSRYGSIGGGSGSGREQSTERSGYASAGPSTSASTLAANSAQAGYGTPPRVSQLHMGRPQIRAAPLTSVTGKSLPLFQRPGAVVGGRPKRSATLDSAIVPSLTTTGIGPGGGRESAGTSAGSASSSSIATPSSAGTGYGGGGAGRMGIHIQTSNITLPVGPTSDASTKGNTPVSRPLPRSPRVRAETAPSPITYRPAGIIVSPTEEEAKALDLSAPLHSHPLESFSDEDSLALPVDTNSSLGSPIEVFIDDQDMTSFSRSPSPMRYARPSSRGSVEDFDDELDEPMFDVDAGYRRDSRSNSRSRSPRRRTRTQPRSYRNSYRLPPRTPERSPSPIHYARRTSLERDDLSPTAEDPEMGLAGAKGKRWTQPRSFQFDYSASTSVSASASANPSPPRTRQSSPDRGRIQPLRRGSKGLVPDERQSRSRSPKRSARKFRSTGSVPAPMPKEEPFVLDISLHQTMISKSERNSLRTSGSGKEMKRRDETGRPGTAESSNSLGTSSTGSGSGRRSVAYPLPTTAPLPLTPHRRVASVAVPATERFDLDDTHGASCGIGTQRRADDGDYKDFTRVGTPSGGPVKPKKEKEKERGRNKERGKADDVEMDFLEGLYSSLRKKDKKDKDEAVVWGTSRDLGEEDNRWLGLGDREALVVTTTIQSSANEMWEEEGVAEVIPKLRSLKVRHGR